MWTVVSVGSGKRVLVECHVYMWTVVSVGSGKRVLVECHVYMCTVVSVSKHYKNQTKRVV
jgi:hypothetical protein